MVDLRWCVPPWAACDKIENETVTTASREALAGMEADTYWLSLRSTVTRATKGISPLEPHMQAGLGFSRVHWVSAIRHTGVMAEPSTRLRLRVSPGSRRSELVGRHGDGWKVRVSAPPEGGRANDALLDLLAARLDLPRRSLSIVSGHTGREKVVQMDGIDRAESERRLEEAVA